jgi:hypothetical protein
LEQQVGFAFPFSVFALAPDATSQVNIEEIENFPLRIFVFFLKGKYILP